MRVRPTSNADSRFVVLKFGGTSVASKERWEVIFQRAKAIKEEGFVPLVVCSAVTGISNALLEAWSQASAGRLNPQDLESIKEVHRTLADALGVAFPAALFAELEETLKGCEKTPASQAAVMAFGELLSTTMGAAFFKAQGFNTAFEDARTCLTARREPFANAERAYLSATCACEPDAHLQARFLAHHADAIVTQGFIAHNDKGETVLLGRGGSDTSAAYFAAKLNAVRCEIWTDVPGMYTADPRTIPSAQVLTALDYDEAQEMATMGAKVLHPRCIAPVKKAHIPLHIRSTLEPERSGTVIANESHNDTVRVKSIATKRKVTLIAIESLGMWQEVGFLADFFAVFKTHGLSIDLVSTSQTNVTVSIDSDANAVEAATLDRLCEALASFGKVKRIESCASVSLVGRNIRSILHLLGPVLQVFEEHQVFLVSQAASDLNLTFVVEEDKAHRLASTLHQLLFESVALVPTKAHETTWWQHKRDALIALAEAESPRFVYDAPTLELTAQSLLSLRSIDRLFYAIKANDNAEVLKLYYDLGLGFECVSTGEIRHLFALFDGLDAKRVLFTPNFAKREEYEAALKLGCHVTVDNLYVLEQWPALFEEQSIFLRLDPGRGLGHHRHVQTAGEQSKFGIASDELDRAALLVRRCGAKVIGLHAHAGSGITKPSHWVEMAALLSAAAGAFSSARILNLGGGLYVPAQLHEEALDLTQFDEALCEFRLQHPDFEIWLEPGRYLVASSGVLLTKVTQLKQKGETRFVGVDVGMNSLIRPALYGAFHPIVNLTREDQDASMVAHVVGPICESGDTLGHDRRLPVCEEGDVMLIASCGAYGRVMSSHYNRRAPAAEIVIGR